MEKINSQQIDRQVRMEAQRIQYSVQMEINKYAITSGSLDCTSQGPQGEWDRSYYRPMCDPSGIVYEAVLSNPVEGATVTLYTADGDYVPQYTKDANGAEVYVDENGNPVAPDNAYTGNGNLTTPDVNNLEPGVLTMTTDADGRYQWMVPAGLWYVTAEKGEDGYVPGSSNNDIAAVVSENGTNWLPVLPAQLNVNIPLVSYDIPNVTAEYDTDGVYLTFSKYMDETTLKAEGAFKIDGKAVDPDNVVLLNSEQAPSNINYGTESAPSYTSMVKLAATNLTGEVTVTIGSGVKSYAGVPCTTNTSGITVAHIVFSHDYSTEWSSDADGHWHECYHCHDKADEAAHTPDREEATETDPIKCVECGYIITPALGHTHNLTKIEAKPATRTEDGNIEYYICEGCDLLFADAAGSVEITEAQTVVAATGNVSNYEQGDLTRDGKVNLYDAVEIAKYMMNMIKLDEEQLSLGDMNGDGKVNLYDAIAVCNIIMG